MSRRPAIQSKSDNAVQPRGKRGVGAPFPIVGVGASAGGLEAFTQLLKALPLDTGMGFVLVQHLDPEHESALTQILSRATKLPVHEVKNNQPVQANHVHIIPPDTNLTVAQGVLKLQPRPRTRTPHRPIDAFFESLAQDQSDRAIGVVLSGTASDGTLGLEAIKAEGGITFAQDDSAKHDSMPRSAVAAGCVDLVLAPAAIAQELARIAKHPYGAGQPLELSMRAEQDRAQATAHEDDQTPLPSGGRGAPPTQARKARAEAKAAEAAQGTQVADDGYKKILLALRNHSGVDFSLYKSSTIQRRIGRRLVLSKHNTLDDYARFLRGNAKELDALYSDVLISVTSFFRNPEMFDALQREVLPALLKQRTDDPVRVWVLGCSTGQEAYSIAMTFVEAAEKAPRARRLQVFATDLNDTLLDKARHGLYARSLADDLTPERLRRFFVEEEGGYRVSKMLREMVVFARQNLISDPPFSRMDLISCRNLLIYLEPSLQKKALPTFHYALKPEGFLLLGASESIGGFTDLFAPVDRKHKIYSKKHAPTPALHLPPRNEYRKQTPPDPLPLLPLKQPQTLEAFAGVRGELNAQHEADRITVNQFAPPGVLVSAELQVLQFRGPTGAYLEPPTGKASFDVLKMARDGLMLPLRAAINEAKKGNKTARRDAVPVKQNGKTRSVNLQVMPLKNLRERCFLILFEEASVGEGQDERAGGRVRSAGRVEPPTRTAALSARQESNRIAELETDLTETRDYLQSMQEEHEAANEELQAANEEVQSANEELQSVNEELETSKEELESANEELITVNEEMSNRNVELNRLNNDLINLQTSARLAIVLLNRDLTIRRFSPQAERQFELLAADVGRPISHIRHNLIFDGASEPAQSRQSRECALDVESMAAEVIASVREQECEVRDRAGRWHSLRVRPYMTLDNKVDGAVLVLVDIDALKHSEQVIAAARDIAENTIETVREPLLVLDKELRVGYANRSFYRAFGVSPQETVGKFVYDLGNRQWDIPRLRELLQEILPQSTTIEDFAVERDFERLGHRMMLVNARRIVDPQRKSERILLAIADITERERAAQVSARLAAIVTSSEDAIISKTLDGVITSWNQGAQHLFGYSAEEAIGKPVTLLIPEDHLDEEPRILERIRRGEVIEHYETVRRRKDGSMVEVSLMVSPMRDDTGRVVGASKIARDITERKQAEEELREAGAATQRLVEELETIYNTTPVGMLQLDSELRYVRINDELAKMNGIPAADHIGRTVREIVPDIADKVEAAFRRILQTGEPVVDIEVIGETPAQPGVQRTWLESWYPFRNAAGQIVGVNVLAQEITERKRAEEALQRHAAQFETLLYEAPLGVYLVDADFRIRHVNPTTFKVFGDLEVIGRDFDEVIHILWPQAYADEIVQRFRHTLETGEPYMTPERIEDRLDRRVTEIYEWQINRIPLPEGRYGVVCYFREISAQVQARAAIAESDQRLRFVMDSAPLKIFTAQPNGDVDYFNPIWMEFTGLSFEQIRDWGWTQFIHPDDVEENVRVWRHSIDTGEPFEFEHRFRRADGEYRWHISRAVPLRDETGRVLMWVGSNTEIHEQRETANQMRQYAAELTDADRRKNEFLALLAHELRNPLAPIRNALHIMRLTDGNGEGVQSASAMLERQVSQMVRLVDDLLDVSRISQDKIELRKGRVELASVVHNAIEAARPLIESMGHELSVALRPQPVYLHADPTRMAQVVGNLLSNACKFTEKGGHIWLTAEREGEQAVIRMRDSGIGIAAEQLPRIFDVFMQIDTSLERTQGGLGIGLTLVKNLVEMHEGTVEVHSDGLGQGSEFVVRLPIWDEAAQRLPEPSVSESTTATARRILVVDDNHDAAMSLAMLLKLAGHETHAAHDGLEALEAAARLKPDVVLLDIGLPKLSGYEVARKLREQSGGNHMMLVALTGWGQDEDRQKSKDAGFDAHMIKPVDLDALTKLLAGPVAVGSG